MKDIMLIIHFIGLAMGLGTSFAHMFLGMASSRMEPEEAKKFRLNTLALSKMGHIGITLLIISGVYLIIPFWEILPSSPLLIIKLVLVVLLVILIAVIAMKGKKAKNGDTAQVKKIEPIGKLAFIIALLIVILAVYIFH